MLHLKIITPDKEIYNTEVDKITCQTTDGEITILPHHVPFLSLLRDGVIMLTTSGVTEYFSAGSGYIETDGKSVRILISEAFGQKELDDKKIQDVKEAAKKLLSENRNAVDRAKAMAMLQRASIDMKILDKIKRRK